VKSMPFLLDQQKVLEPLARALETGFTEAARNRLHGSATVGCTTIERTSLSGQVPSGANAAGFETRFDSGISGGSLLVVEHRELGRLGGLLSGMECPEGEPIAPEVLESVAEFIGQGMESSCKSFAQSCGLPIHCAMPDLMNPDGTREALLSLGSAYSKANGLTLCLKVENRPDSHIGILIHDELLAALNAQLPHYGTHATGNSAAGAEAAPAKPQPRWNMDLILDVELEVAVSFGETQLPLRDILKLGVGSVIELEKGVNDPVAILVNDKPIARGEVVMVDGNYGVKVLEVESTADRIRSLG
jgi:flagellar motor switch protein FliN